MDICGLRTSVLLQTLSNRRVSSSLLFVFVLFILFSFTYHSSSNYRTLPKSVPQNPPGDWTWSFARDRKSFVLNQTQCVAAFPDLYADIDRTVEARKGRKITSAELDGISIENGFVRGMIHDQTVYVIAIDGRVNSRGYATLLSLNRAVAASPEPLPNIEFVFSAVDWLDPAPRWTLAKKVGDDLSWLMPDFSFWSWPEPKVGAYAEVQEKAIEMEESRANPSGKMWSWKNKKPQVMWRGATMNVDLRRTLIEVAKGKSWADVKEIIWDNEESKRSGLKSMAEHCQYKFPINTAGQSYSGRLKYLQNCRSAIVMHEDDWLTHYSHVMKSDGPEQNFVQVKRDFSDLESKITALLADDAKAKRIADNNVATFRERYLTPAAETCYWRQLIRSWASISFEPEFYKTNQNGSKSWRGVPVESYILERRLEWDPY